MAASDWNQHMIVLQNETFWRFLIEILRNWNYCEKSVHGHCFSCEKGTMQSLDGQEHLKAKSLNSKSR